MSDNLDDNTIVFKTPAAPVVEPAPIPAAPEVTPTRAEAPEAPAAEPGDPWREPVYTSHAAGPENVYSPTVRGNGYGAEYARHNARTETTPKRAAKPWGAGKTILVLLLAVVLCAGAGSGAALLTTRHLLADQDAGKQVVIGSTGTDATPMLTASPDASAGLSGQEIYSIACRQVVGINTQVTTNVFGQTSSTAVSGSGFVISADGYILTNYHVVEYAVTYDYDMTVLFYDGSSYPASIVSYEKDSDVAVVKIDAVNLEPVTFCNSMVVGEDVFVIGNPLGELTYTMTDGIVSATDRAIATDEYTTIDMFQINAAVNSGNSGGPVYNARGQVIGIVTAKYASAGVEGLGFAIPIEDAVSIATQLIENGYVTGKAYLGITVQDVSDSVSSYFNMPVGAYIYSVTAGGAADKAGMKTGDIITAIDDHVILSVSDLKTTLKSYSAGDTVELKLYRSGEYLTLTITLEESVPATPSIAG